MHSVILSLLRNSKNSKKLTWFVQQSDSLTSHKRRHCARRCLIEFSLLRKIFKASLFYQNNWSNKESANKKNIFVSLISTFILCSFDKSILLVKNVQKKPKLCKRSKSNSSTSWNFIECILSLCEELILMNSVELCDNHVTSSCRSICTSNILSSINHDLLWSRCHNRSRKWLIKCFLFS